MSPTLADVHPHTGEAPETDTTEILPAASVFEIDFHPPDDGRPMRSAKEFLREELGYSEAEIERRKPYLKALNRLAWEKPENWTGRPFAGGSTFEIWTIEDANI